MNSLVKYNVVNLEQDSDAWREFRKDKIGASDIPAVLNLRDSYQSRDELLNEKITGVQIEHDSWTKAAMQFGKDKEPMIRQFLIDKLGTELKPIVIQSTENPKFMASLDGLSEDGTHLVEIKTTGSEKIFTEVTLGIAPEKWRFQIYWQAMLSGATKATLACMFKRTGSIVTLNIPIDSDQFEPMKREAVRFLKDMSQGVSPFQNLETDEMTYIARSKAVIKEYQKLIDAEEEKIKGMAEKILDLNAAERITGCGVEIYYETRRGAVNYKSIPQVKEVLSKLSEEYIDKYRGKGSRPLRIELVKEKKLIESKESNNE